MSFAAALAGGAIIGVRHALEADHLAAIATLVEDGDDNPGLVGASWGVGHSLPIAALGLMFLVADVRIPESVTHFFEVFVGLVLVGLGLRMLADVTNAFDSGVNLFSHDHDEHGSDHSHDHPHTDSHDHSHSHVRVGRFSLGTTHTHLDGDSFLVGVLHGFAGSGVLVVVLVATANTLQNAVAFLAAFSALTVATMAGVSLLWGRALDRTSADTLKGAAAVAGITVGCLLIAGQFGLVS